MDYISAVESACRAVEAERGVLSEVHSGLELVLAGWQLHAAAAAMGRQWDVLGSAVQTVAEDFHDQPPIGYTITANDNTAEVWRRTVRLVEVIAVRLDNVASEPECVPDRSWWAATAAARLRAALPQRS